MSGGGGSVPEKQEITQTNLPAYARPYFERSMDRTEALATRDYEPYTGQRLAAPSADTLAAESMARGIAGTGITGLPGAMDVASSNMAAGQDIANNAAPYTFNRSEFSTGDTSAGTFDDTQLFTPDAAQQYMSPYIQNVLDRQMAEQRRQFAINQGARDSAAVGAGAFGGSRQAVEQSLARADLERQQGDTYAQGLQSAYEDAQRAFGADRGAQFEREQSQMAERARAQGLTVEELNRVESATAAENARVESSQATENARATQEKLQALGFSAEQAANMLDYGMMDRATNVQNSQILDALGKATEGRDQAAFDLAYSNFVAQRDFPMENEAFLASILRGVPVTPNMTTTVSTPTNPGQEALGTGLQVIGTYKGLTA